MNQFLLTGTAMSVLILAAGCGKPAERQAMKHDRPPQTATDVPPAMLAKIEALKNSPYYAHVKELEQHVVGRIVTKAEAGTSGFVLYLGHEKWVLAHMSGTEFSWKVGDGALSDTDRKLLNSALFGNASAPLAKDVPYASQQCDFSAEVKKAVGQKISGLSYGERCFNFCFPNGRELDVTLREDTSGKLGYRVFWEQW